MQPQAVNVSESLSAFFDAEALERLARETQFVQRQPVVDGRIFAQTMVFGCLEEPEPSLNHWAQVCYDLGVEITAQGLDERITERSVAFMAALLARGLVLLRQRVALPLAVLASFTAVYLVDSSTISLPAHLAAEFPSSGGKASPAGLKVQLVLDFLHGTLEQVALRPGREPDQQYHDYLRVVQPGSLTLHDLGYATLDHLATISDEKQGYWISRYKFGTGVYTASGTKVDLLPFLQTRAETFVELLVTVGQQHRLPCRLLAFRLPQEAADRRRQHAKEQARQKGRTLSPAYLALLDWAIFITNVPATMLRGADVATLYRVRWQIELVFKVWKSKCGITHVGHCRRARILTELYAKMIGILLTQFILAPLRMPYGQYANRELSPMKVRGICKRFARELNRAVGHAQVLVNVLHEMHTQILRFGFKQKRRKCPNVCHMLALLSSATGVEIENHQDLELQFILP